MGGGPSDLVFPEQFLGRWEVESVLTNVELPLGPEFVPDMAVSAHSRGRHSRGWCRHPQE